jgi:hypothetical protein
MGSAEEADDEPSLDRTERLLVPGGWLYRTVVAVDGR